MSTDTIRCIIRNTDTVGVLTPIYINNGGRELTVPFNTPLELSQADHDILVNSSWDVELYDDTLELADESESSTGDGVDDGGAGDPGGDASAAATGTAAKPARN